MTHTEKVPESYKVAHEFFQSEFEKKCQGYFRDGWEPVGGMHVYMDVYERPVYCQAFIKYRVETTDLGPG